MQKLKMFRSVYKSSKSFKHMHNLSFWILPPPRPSFFPCSHAHHIGLDQSICVCVLQKEGLVAELRT